MNENNKTIAFVSDIHGNYSALKAVLEDIEKKGCKTIFSLGDVAGYYSMVNECINLLKEKNIPNIMGNHDDYIISGTGCPRSNSANDCLEYQRRVLLPEHIDWLKKSPLGLVYRNISIVHAGWNDPLDEYMLDFPENYFDDMKEKWFLSGHSHVQYIRQLNEKTYCNPGSVGQPRDGDPRAAYAILKDDAIYLERVEYDIDEISFHMKQQGFDEYYYKNLYTGTAIGGKVFKNKYE